MSTQNTETPIEFVKAVEKYLKIDFYYDMAAFSENKKAPIYYTEKENSLRFDWPLDGWCWLNPPFNNLKEWVNKCKEQYLRGVKIVSIWPCSCDMNMIECYKNCDIYMIHRRVWLNVRGCMVCVWHYPYLNNHIFGLEWNKKEKELIRIW